MFTSSSLSVPHLLSGEEMGVRNVAYKSEVHHILAVPNGELGFALASALDQHGEELTVLRIQAPAPRHHPSVL
jgi:hypothetical protein